MGGGDWGKGGGDDALEAAVGMSIPLFEKKKPRIFKMKKTDTFAISTDN